MALANTYLVEAENGFIGMQSRNNPLELQPGYVQYAQNMRFDRGTAAVRKGLKRLTAGTLVGEDTFGSGTYSSQTGNEYIVLVGEAKLFILNVVTQVLTTASYPTGRTVALADNVDVIQANNVLYILRGEGDAAKAVTTVSHVGTLATVTVPAHGWSNGNEVIVEYNTQPEYNGSFVISGVTTNTFQYTMTGSPSSSSHGATTARRAKAPLVWDGVTTVTVVPQGVTTSGSANMPCADFGVYFKNRLIYQLGRDRIAASNYLSYDSWDLDFEQFVINLGQNDYIVGFQPWQEDQFLVFQRNSIYYAYIDPDTYQPGDPPGGDSFIKSLTLEFGCSARRSIVNAGEYMFFLSDNGVYLLNPSLDLKLLGNTTPLSDRISDIMSRINATAVSNAVAKIFNNRYYLAVPVDGATRNNVVLVYSMLNKEWESVDTFPDGMYIDDMEIALYGDAKRLYYTNIENGIFLTEEEDFDEFDDATGTPTLPFVLPAEITTNFVQYPVAGSMLTRRYFYNTYAGKRFSGAEVDILCNAGDSLKITAIATNPDNSSEVFRFASSTAEDYTKRFPIAKVGFGLDLLVESITGRPTVRGLRVSSTVPGRTLISAE